MENTCYVGQPYGANYISYYRDKGLKGHTGVDIACGFGTPIYSPFDGYIYKVINKANRGNDGYTSIFMIVDDGIECFEWSIGHCNPTVEIGETVRRGDLIGTEANNGLVYSGNLQITLAMQKKGDERGSHRHLQKRPVMRTMPMIPSREYLTAFNGKPFRNQVGYYYEVFAPDNGYNGAMNPVAPVLNRDLFLGRSGYDVYVLQRYLKRQKLFNSDATGFYGFMTLEAVRAFQHWHNIKPLAGYLGPKTREFINLNAPDILAL